ncbi:hypothetical protein AVEN_97487-1 [Araneus ventricosus]|uniref:Integrase zinc-binding domain-containing protein n=1 Tax=Araneus ventricosus TaxID=182803 RepID=A0A4Y2UDA2_ARAVE|nr:hypothetical protein AVEN_97487-1 [Araneus ventricosus]
MKHGRIATTLAKIRSRFWIPEGRQIVQKIIRKCLISKRYSAKSADQLASQLPEDKIAQTPPFYTCSVDFAGPIYVKNLERDAEILYRFVYMRYYKSSESRTCTYHDYGIFFNGV